MNPLWIVLACLIAYGIGFALAWYLFRKSRAHVYYNLTPQEYAAALQRANKSKPIDFKHIGR